MTRSSWIVGAGDTLAMANLILIGFATHGETGLSFLPRMSVLFFPLVISWFILAPWLGLFQHEIVSNSKQLWRPALVMLFAVPLAVTLRGLILNAPIIPIFVIVLSATSALGMVVWRGLYYFIKPKMR